MLRPILIAAVGTLWFAPSAVAADPLLSGYGGPGGGEQAILGEELLAPGGGSASGTAPRSLRAAPTRAPARPPSTGATPGPADPSPVGPAAAGGERQGAKTDGEQRTPRAPSAPGAAGVATAPTPGAPAIVAYPTRASDAGSSGLGDRDIALLALGATALILLAFGLRRLRPPPEGRA